MAAHLGRKYHRHDRQEAQDMANQGQQGQGQQAQQAQQGQGQQAQSGGNEPRQMGLGDLTGLLSMGPDMLLQVLAMVVDGLGTGTEWTGEQVARLGELQQQLADKISAMGSGGGGGAQ